MDWLANGSLPWAAYCAFMSGRLIALGKQPGVWPVGIGETLRSIFAKIVLKVTGPEATMTYQDDQLCAGLKARINDTVHVVQALWDESLTTEDWGFLLLDTNSAFNEINQVGMLWTVRHLWPSGACLSFIAIVTGHHLFCGMGMGRPVFCIVRRA